MRRNCTLQCVNSSVTVALPASIANDVEPDGFRVLCWEAPDEPPTEPVQLWVPEYPSTYGPQTWSAGLAALPELEVVQLLSAGVDPWPALLPEGVTLCNGRGIHGASTAELAVATTLAMLRELPRYLNQQRERTWLRHPPQVIAGTRVLVVGAGDIGTRVARALQAIDADVTLVGRTARDGVRSTDELPGLLPSHQVVVLAVPSTPETTGMVDADFLAALPDGALVVNVARGQVVDTDALTAEVLSGRLRAALDVTDPEPLPADHPLWTADGALITPHAGGGADGWQGPAARLAAAQARRLVEGAPLLNVVGQAGY